MRSIGVLMVLLFCAGCETDENELDGGMMSADTGEERDMALEPDAEEFDWPTCEEIPEVPCEAILAEQPGGEVCLVAVQSVAEELCFVDYCAFAFVGEVRLESQSCKILTDAATAEDGTSFACACISGEVAGDVQASLEDNVVCAPYVCQ